MNPTLLALALALLLLAAAVGLWWGSIERHRRQAHQQHLQRQLQRQGTPLPSGSGEMAGPTDAALTRNPLDNLFARAGLQPGWRIPILILGIFALLVALAGWRLHDILGSLIMAVICAALLAFWLAVRMHRQRKKLISQLPDFLENMVRLTSIGQSLPMAFQGASEHVEAPLRHILQDCLRRMRAGMDMDAALHQSSHDYHVKELDLLESVLRMSNQYGGRTDQVLQRMSDFMRDLEHAQQDLRSITSETRMSSWVLGLLPPVVCVVMMLLNPEFFRPMFTHTLGHELLLAALCLEALGAFALYRLAKSL